MVARQLRDAIETLGLLRMRVLRSDPKDPELRSSFRELSRQLEHIRQLNPASSEEVRQLAAWLSMFLHADFGMRLREYGQLSDAKREALIDHIRERRRLLQQAESEVPPLHTAIGACLTMLSARPDAADGLEKQARHLAGALKDHMQDDEKLSKSVQEFINAMQQSLESICATLGGMGEDIPELAETRSLLDAELPDDPKQAHALLQKARANMLRAGQKVGQAGQLISRTLESQKAQLQHMSENLHRAEFEAHHDTLTGLGNRRLLAEMLKSLGERKAAFLILDIDHFKKINDRYGHDTGDEVLVAVSRMLSTHVRAADIIARVGGEEFAAIFPDADAQSAACIAETLRATIEAGSVKTRKGKIAVTISVGVAMRKPTEPVSQWLGRGDMALYEAKNSGRNRIAISPE